MRKFTVIFAHGRESGPWGTKIRAMAKVVEALGGCVVSPDHSDTRDPELRVARLIAEAGNHDDPIVLVGSSMGGYVATLASRTVNPVGLFLMAPAFGMPGYQNPSPQPCAGSLSVVYGWDDPVVPFEGVMTFAHTYRATLHVVPAGHALVEQMDWLTRIFALFLEDSLALNEAPPAARLMATF